MSYQDDNDSDDIVGDEVVDETVDAEVDEFDEDLFDDLVEDDQRASSFPSLFVALRRLDTMLVRAVKVASSTFAEANEAFRGLYIDNEEVQRHFLREPGEPMFWTESEGDDSEPIDESLPHELSWLAQVYGLTRFDLDTLLIALAPELDQRYERIFAYLQNDVTKKRPTVSLALSLLSSSAADALQNRARFEPSGPLRFHRVLRTSVERDGENMPLLAQELRLDPQIIRFVLDDESLDARLVKFCQLIDADNDEEDDQATENRAALNRLVNHSWVRGQPLRAYFQGSDQSSMQREAIHLAREIDRCLMQVDARLLLSSGDVSESILVLFREAWLKDAILFVQHFDALRSAASGPDYELVLQQISHSNGVLLVAGSQPWTPVSDRPLGIVPFRFEIPGIKERRAWWRQSLESHQVEVDEEQIELLADRLLLTGSQIAETVAMACSAAACASCGDASDSEPTPKPSFAELLRTARRHTKQELAEIAKKIEPQRDWADLVLPHDLISQLREICQRVAKHRLVFQQWGFDRKLSLGKGTSVLFAGASGTGKTLAAEVLAGELGLDLYRVDLSGIVSKYIGETEKNLNRVFAAAENTNAILFFDEADALFGKRSEVRDSHDRYANIEISYLLQKMEDYNGIAVLATNLRKNLDDSFIRRLAFTLQFPLPDANSRLLIWEMIWPDKTPLADDVCFKSLADHFKVSGGNIKNIALAAAFLAADSGGPVTMDHLRHATRREYQKMGKVLQEDELIPSPSQLPR